MSHPCQRSNPLVRGGTDQQARQLKALATDHFQVDERTLADFILFARRYARNIRYYGEGAGSNTSWEAFFAQDLSVNLATLASVPLQRFIDFKDSLRRFLEQGETLNEATRNAYFALLLQLPLLLLHEVGTSAARLPRNETLIRQLDKWAGRELNELLLLKSYVLGAGTAPLQGFSDQPLQVGLLHTDANLPSPLLLVPAQILQRVTTLDWADLAAAIYASFPATLDSTELANVSADATPYQQAASHHEQVYDALNYNLLIGAIEKLLSSIQAVITLAAAALEESLQRSDHTPHYGLWLAFLRLYRHPQQLLNAFTGRHLDFYYREVLQLQPLPPTPDQVALVLELAKHKQEYLLPKGTRFNAGKDSAQVPRHYALVRDMVVNRGQLTELKSFFLQRDGSLSYPYAAQQTNSADGIDATLDKQDPQWPPFGPVHPRSAANIGFAVADPKLRLSDGTRVVTLKFTFVTPLPATVQQVFAGALSIEDGWLLLDDSQLQVSKSGNELSFKITLASDQSAILPYDAAIHGCNFSTTEPVLRLWLKPASGRFSEWVNARVSQTRLSVSVSGTRKFSIANDLGTLDPAKPFMPYGAVPKINGHFMLGGKELFSKPLATLTLHPVWQEPCSFDTHYSRDANPFAARVRVEYLKAGRWQALSEPLLPLFAHAATLQGWQQLFVLVLMLLLYFGMTVEQIFFGQGSYATQLGQALAGQGLTLTGLDTRAGFETLDERYQTSSRAGFVRFALLTAFGQEQYPQENTLAILANASTTDSLNYTPKGNLNYSGVVPKQPYTPVLSALTLDYTSSDDSPATLFHQFPFGSRPVSGANPSLLPPLQNAGELYLGLEAMTPPQSVSLLFAAVAGSANPLKPPATLQWHYLQGDDWVEIAATAISDTTSSLSGSGLIAFELPAQADTQHSILPAGKHWLRLSVASDTDAVCKLLSIHTQAALAVLVENGNAEDVLATPLPAGSIAKLVVPDTAIKSIQQPLPSFGGKPAEQTRAYRQRVSERLRHKNRAVTIWDYEHLVLQHFPQVFKVRCLNHTALCRDEGSLVVAENGLHPGAVLVVPIPLLQENSASDPHRPYNTTRTLADIDAFLRSRISPFVHLEVQNPRIEEIQLSFRVAFTDEVLDTGFYLTLLNQELNQYLMPWAYAGKGQVDFGGKWYKSVLINFIEELPYVNFIKDVRMFHRTDILSHSSQWQLNDKEVVRASAARSILVSHPQHQISSIDEVAV